MSDGAFGIGHVIFHILLFAVLHGTRSQQVFKTRRGQGQSRSHNQPRVTIKPLRPSQRCAEKITDN